MDILQKALKNLKSCGIERDTVVVDGYQYPASKVIRFETTENKEYSLGVIMTYLLDIRMPHHKYVEVCTTRNIKPVTLSDKPRIFEEIRSYTPKKPDGFFIYPSYTFNRKYEIPTVSDEFLIVLSNSLTARISISNVVDLLTHNALEPSEGCLFASRAETFEHCGVRFRAVNDTSGFTQEDWERVKVVFLDDIDDQMRGWGYDIAKLSQNAVFLSVEPQSIRGFRLVVEGNRLKNYDDMWIRILGCINK